MDYNKTASIALRPDFFIGVLKQTVLKWLNTIRYLFVSSNSQLKKTVAFWNSNLCAYLFACSKSMSPSVIISESTS
jgi:hypothetical protein